MRQLRDFIYLNPSSERVERKFILNNNQIISADIALRKIGFKKIFPNRNIESVYFDDLNHSCIRDNIDGQNSRDKLRIRYYNKDMKNFSIETKHKRGFLVYKTSNKILNEEDNLDNILNLTNNWCKQHIKEILLPSALINYNRQYFIKGLIRATIDTKIRGFRKIGKNFLSSSPHTYAVVEFKYPKGLDNEFRNAKYYKYFALRNTKCSKYTKSLVN